MEQFASLLCPNDVRAITGKGKIRRYFDANWPRCNVLLLS